MKLRMILPIACVGCVASVATPLVSCGNSMNVLREWANSPVITTPKSIFLDFAKKYEFEFKMSTLGDKAPEDFTTTRFDFCCIDSFKKIGGFDRLFIDKSTIEVQKNGSPLRIVEKSYSQLHTGEFCLENGNQIDFATGDTSFEDTYKISFYFDANKKNYFYPCMTICPY